MNIFKLFKKEYKCCLCDKNATKEYEESDIFKIVPHKYFYKLKYETKYSFFSVYFKIFHFCDEHSKLIEKNLLLKELEKENIKNEVIKELNI